MHNSFQKGRLTHILKEGWILIQVNLNLRKLFYSQESILLYLNQQIKRRTLYQLQNINKISRMFYLSSKNKIKAMKSLTIESLSTQIYTYNLNLLASNKFPFKQSKRIIKGCIKLLYSKNRINQKSKIYRNLYWVNIRKVFP